MGFRKRYIKPEVTKIILDNTITLMMVSNPGPRGGGSKGGSNGTNKPFASPFGDKPFS
jgi:hypothetical protein